MKRWALLMLLACATCQAQTQIMTEQKRNTLLTYIPKIDDNPVITAKIQEALLYTDEEIPPRHQSQPLIGGTGAPYTTFMSIYQQVNGSFLPTNMNRDFPWGAPGGLHLVPSDQRYEYRLLWLPPKPGGGVYPVIVYQSPMERSTRVNMPSPNGWRWIFPYGAILGEVLMKNFTDGSFAVYEVRLRQRDTDAWNFERYRPSSEGLPQFTSVVKETLQSTHPRIRAFSRTATTAILPPMQGARDFLRRATFVSVMGTDDIIPTARDRDNIVPMNYAGHFLTDCTDCHRDTLREASQFEEREWYDYERGSADGIFSFNPFAPNSNGQRNPPLHPTLAAAGMVEMFDPAKHASDIYTRIPEFDNGPRANARINAGSRVVGGKTQ